MVRQGRPKCQKDGKPLVQFSVPFHPQMLLMKSYKLKTAAQRDRNYMMGSKF